LHSAIRSDLYCDGNNARNITICHFVDVWFKWKIKCLGFKPKFYLEVFSDNYLFEYIMIVWFETGFLKLVYFETRTLVSNFGFSGKYGLKGLKPKLSVTLCFGLTSV